MPLDGSKNIRTLKNNNFSTISFGSSTKKSAVKRFFWVVSCYSVQENHISRLHIEDMNLSTLNAYIKYTTY